MITRARAQPSVHARRTREVTDSNAPKTAKDARARWLAGWLARQTVARFNGHDDTDNALCAVSIARNRMRINVCIVFVFSYEWKSLYAPTSHLRARERERLTFGPQRLAHVAD